MHIKRWAKIGPIQHGLVHRWKESEGGTIDSFPFLGNRHCHMLEVTVWIEQNHNQRDIEYLFADGEIRAAITFALGGTHYYTGRDQQNWSCEKIAEEIYRRIIDYTRLTDLKNRDITIEVLEDGRNGAVVEFLT